MASKHCAPPPSTALSKRPFGSGIFPDLAPQEMCQTDWIITTRWFILYNTAWIITAIDCLFPIIQVDCLFAHSIAGQIKINRNRSRLKKEEMR